MKVRIDMMRAFFCADDSIVAIVSMLSIVPIESIVPVARVLCCRLRLF